MCGKGGRSHGGHWVDILRNLFFPLSQPCLLVQPTSPAPSPWKPAARSKAGEEMMPQAQQRHSLPDQRRALITKDREWGKNADNSLGPEEASGLPDELNL